MTGRRTVQNRGVGQTNKGQFGYGRTAADGGTADKRAAALGTPGDDGSRNCSKCGKATKRKDGVCRTCTKSAGGSKPKRKSAAAKPNKNEYLDTTRPSLSPDEVGRCDFSDVSEYRGGAATGGVRQCKNAVRLPEQRCHQHGGAVSASLGRTVAKATAEAERGECFPLNDAYWSQADTRMEQAHGMLSRMMQTDISKVTEQFSAYFARKSKDGTGRWSANNQSLALMQHVMQNWDGDTDADFERAFEVGMAKMAEPHMTDKMWAKHGREPDGEGVAIMWYTPSSRFKVDATDDDDPELVDEDGKKTVQGRAKLGGMMEYPMSSTSGDPYETPDPVVEWKPKSHGDAAGAVDELAEFARESGYEVEFTDNRPGSASGYWSPDANDGKGKIVVWNGVGGGDDAAKLRTMAHELGHATMGHGTDADKENRRPDQEAAAESFAYLMAHRYGIDLSERSAHYIDTWKKDDGVDMSRGGHTAFMSAVEAYDTVMGQLQSQDA